MKKISVFILAGLFLFMMSCNNDEEAAEEAAENLVEGLFENVTGGDIDIDVNEDGETVEMTIGGEDGLEISINDEGTEIPESFPDDVYLIKGKIESAGSIKSGNGELITVEIYPEDDFKTVVAKIKKEMESSGWKIGMNMNMGDQATQMYTKDDNSATISIIKEDDKKTIVSYLVTVAKK